MDFIQSDFLLINPMVQKLIKKKIPSEEEPQSHPIYIDEGIMQKITFIATALRWSRNTFIVESIKHIFNLIDHYDNNIIPDFVLMTHALQMANRFNFRMIKDPEESKTKKIQTGVAIPTIFLRKIDSIVDSIGSSRNAFISRCLIHSINIVRDDLADPLPDIVKASRAYACKERRISNFQIVEPSPIVEKKLPENIGYRRKKKTP